MSNVFKLDDFMETEVEIPQLSAFLIELKQVCKKYDIGFKQDKYDSDLKTIEIVPYKDADLDFLIEYLEDCEIPFIAETIKLAKKNAKQKHEEMKAKSKLEYELNRKVIEAQTLFEQENHAKSVGIKLSDGLYKLVKVEPE